MPSIKLLKKKYDDEFSISIENWTFPDNQVTILNGPSGAGKSSIIKLLLGLEPADQCEWSLKGKDIHILRPPERHFSVVFQTYDLFPHMTALENIRFFAKCRDVSEDSFKEDLNELVSVLKMSNFLNRYPQTLSGGEKQRVALSRALISRPQMIFLDEPFSALDSESRGKARELLSQIIQIRQIPCLLVSHDEDDKKQWKDSSFSIVGEITKTIIKDQ